MGDSLTTSPAWRIILMILFGMLAVTASWYIQGGMNCLHLQNKAGLFLSLGCGAAFVIIGMVSGCAGIAAVAVGANLVFGLAAAYSGKRTEQGNQIRDEIFGLRRYMRKVTKPELLRIVRSNTDYYYELAPYALALGVDKRFASRFGGLRQSSCTWLVTGMDSASTASEWYGLLREVYRTMNLLQNRPPWEKLLNPKLTKRL